MKANKKYIAPYNPKHEDTFIGRRTRTVPKVEEDVPDIFGPHGEMRPFSQQMAHEERKKTRKEKQAKKPRKQRENVKYPKSWKEQLKERPTNYDKIFNITQYLGTKNIPVSEESVSLELGEPLSNDDIAALNYILEQRRGGN